MSDTCLTVFTKRTGILTKRISLTPEQQVLSDSSDCKMWEGTAKRAHANTAAQLSDLIATLGRNQALALGRLSDNIPENPKVVTRAELDKHPGAIARTREFIDYRKGLPAWALIDFDTKGMPPEVAALIRDAGGLWAFLCKLIPGVASAAHVVRASTSAGLYNTQTGEAIPGSDGQHIYILVADGGDVVRFLRNLHDRFWLDGAGWHRIGKAGQHLDRSPIDCSVATPEGLKFEGPAVIEPPLAQDAERRCPIAHEGVAIDTLAVSPPLTAYEQARVQERKDKSTKALKNDAAAVRRQYDKEHAEKLSKRHGVPIETARRLVAQCRNGFLSPYAELQFDDLGTKAVADVLADPENYVGATLADPIEGVDYGRCKAMVMRSDDGTLFVHSFAHGRSIYRLRYDLRIAISEFKKSPTVDRAVEILASTNFEIDERDQFRNEVSSATQLKPSAISKRFKNAEQLRARDLRRAAAEAAIADDNRIVRSCPPANGALQAEVDFIDSTLAADASAAPPMRDYNGKLIEVRSRAPFDLHTLVQEGEDTTEAPLESTILELSPTAIELLVEKYIQYRVLTLTQTYPASLPRPFITALNEYQNSALPVLKVINSSPLITASGEIIDGEGLDRDTGIFHQIDAPLRSCLPKDTPSNDDVRRAIRFLCDEWLVDVALDHTGKYVTIMLALSLIERSLLPERPAFFIVAGLRGSGKTTLAHMIATAVLGHAAPAASWSDVDEERKKALFSIFRQGIPFVVWDNIRRGEAVTCPHAEASLTSPRMTDRILGVSKTETVSTATIQVFTGNQIAPKGDMSSRSFMIVLNADRPDPERRDFVHPDPLDWTRANRFRIMSALYTILVAGTRNRKPDEMAKTRFKTWWRLVGWPVEYAASLVGHELNCDSVIRSGEAEDSDLLAIAAALNTFRTMWGDKRFTARDIVQKLPDEFSISNSAEGQVRAVLFESLSELLGKPLVRPTTRSMAKLLQRRLVGHPVWLADDRIATLRVFKNHEAHQYSVEVTLTKNGSQPVSTGRNNPDNPVNPDGNVGIDGIVSIQPEGTNDNVERLRIGARPVCGKSGAAVRGDHAIVGNVSTSQSTVGRKPWPRSHFRNLSDPDLHKKFAQIRRALDAPNCPDNLDAQKSKSESDSNKTYYVTRNADGHPLCTCFGFKFSGKCRHVR
jgi:hypothetical protein